MLYYYKWNQARRENDETDLDTAGTEITAVCYDGVYYTNTSEDDSFFFRRAAPLLNGYAPVSSNLDSRKRDDEISSQSVESVDFTGFLPFPD